MNIRGLHIELTTFCNLSCRFCSHTSNHSYHLDYDMFVKNVLQDDISNIEHIAYIGSHGDFTMYPNFFKVIEKTLSNFKGVLELGTHGYAHDSSWWFNLGGLIGDRGSTFFAIDGLEDTHKVHRDSDFSTVVKNMSSYISGGGKAVWKFIIFEHNEHQVDLARRFAKDIGCSIEIHRSRYYDHFLKRPKNLYDVSELHTRSNKDCDFSKGTLYIGADGIVSPCSTMQTFKRVPELFNSMSTEQKIIFLKDICNLNIYEKKLSEIISSSEYLRFAFKNRVTSDFCRNKHA